MGGCARAHLIEADDRNFYVVKFQNNSQGRRTLVNEWIATAILKHLGIPTPDARTVAVPRGFLKAYPKVYMDDRAGHAAVEPGLHFGSRHSGNSKAPAVPSLSPDMLLTRVTNLEQFRAVLVFDRWVGNLDRRQCVFVGVPAGREFAGLSAGFRKYTALMIDHGQAFSGDRWLIPDSAIIGLYPREIVYHNVRSIEDFNPWLSLVENFPSPVLTAAVRQIPADWLGKDDRGPLDRLLEVLVRRQKRIGEIMQACRRARSHPFLCWSN